MKRRHAEPRPEPKLGPLVARSVQAGAPVIKFPGASNDPIPCFFSPAATEPSSKQLRIIIQTRLRV